MLNEVIFSTDEGRAGISIDIFADVMGCQKIRDTVLQIDKHS